LAANGNDNPIAVRLFCSDIATTGEKEARSMLRSLIAVSVGNPLIVLLCVAALVGVGGYSFWNVNVEAYPDPAPAIIEVVAQFPGASAEEVERQVTVPLEVALAGMPGLKYTRSKSLAGLSHLRNQFDYGFDYNKARQEVINRLAAVNNLPPGVSATLSPVTPTGELIRYTLKNPKDALGREVYTLNDLKALQDWVLQREFKRVPGVIDVTGFGGTVKRYEVRPDPRLLQSKSLSLNQVQSALAGSNQNVGADVLLQGPNAMNVRGVGLFGQGADPAQEVLGWADPVAAAHHLRQEEAKRSAQIRKTVVATVNNQPIDIDHIVEGGPLTSPGQPSTQGVVLGYRTRLGKVGRSTRVSDNQGDIAHYHWQDEPDVIEGIVLMRKYEKSKDTLEKVNAKIDELNNTPGKLLPGVQLDRIFDLSRLIHLTTETVQDNLLVGMGLVTVVLLMFLSNVRSAFIVAVNVPLALLFAFSVLFLRGKSANLLSIGAVDFGIIVDSSVIMVENIYRHISAGENPELPLKERIVRASGEVQRALLFSTLIMVCAFLPLFTMSGPEGQIFGPMADTYAFALAGALVLALTLAPVLCLLLFRHLKPARDNFMVRFLKRRYLWQLNLCLRFRWITLGVMAVLLVFTATLIPQLGGEFMPELEEGNMYIRGTFPVNITLEEAAAKVKIAREIMRSYDEVELVVAQTGRPDDGTDPTGFYNAEFQVPLKPEKEWPKVKDQEGWRKRRSPRRARTKDELREEMKAELDFYLPGVDWNFSQYIRDNVTESLSGVKGDNSVKIIGPDLKELEKIAEQVKAVLEEIDGMKEVGIFHVLGQPNLELRPDPDKCARWGVNTADVMAVIQSAVGGKAFSQMIEGGKSFDITLRWPEQLRNNLEAILNLEVDVPNNQVTPGFIASRGQTPLTGAQTGLSATGTSQAMPAPIGSVQGGTLTDPSNAPRRRLRDLVTPVNELGQFDPNGDFIRPGASTIYREEGKRLIAVKFSVRGRDLAGAVAEAQEKTKDLVQPPYELKWAGEFEEMEAANKRLAEIIPISVLLILVLLYLAFGSILDTVVVLSNVVALSMGGIWALWLTSTHFSIAAAVGFISIFGVAVMDGLLSISYFNALRAHGVPLREAILEGAGRRMRPMMMTALTAIFGLLPAALSTRIGAQTQRPLAIVVVGGMIVTLLLNRYLMPVLYSFYGGREPAAGSGDLAH
jgi:cobalt-zinc-cadmium resistance protein CzcA